MKRLLALLLFLLAIQPFCAAQKTLVYGRIVEASTGSPIAFAGVLINGTSNGTHSDELGAYLLETTEPFDSLRFSAIGYQDTVIAIQKFVQQEIRIRLRSQDYLLGEFVFNAGENPAFAILRKVVANKPVNDPDQFQAYEYRSYNKVQFDLNNFSDKIKKNLLFKPFPFIWQYQDSMPNGVRYLPFLLKENVRQHYYRKSPEAYKEYIVGAQKAQFFRGPQIENFIEELYLNPNIYQNFVLILKKSFPSPVNDHFSRFYKYVLDDTLSTQDGLPCYHIRFYPKGASDVAFTGDMYIHDSTYAVKQINLNFSVESNVNFVRSFFLRMDYDWLEQQHWFIREIKVLADFTVAENSPELTGFFGRRFSEYKNVRINQPRENSLYAPVENVIETDSIPLQNDAFWQNERKDTLTDQEQNIQKLVDTIQDNWKFQLVKNTFTAIGSGWAPYKNIDFGHIFSFFSYNDIEGARIKLGFRTSPNSEFPLQSKAYIAYGTRDQRWKYMGELDWIFGKKFGKHNLIGAAYRKDVDQLGLSYYAIPIDHILTFLLQVAPFDTRTFVENQSAYIERQWFLGFVTRASVFKQNVAPFGDYAFLNISDPLHPLAVPGFNLSGWKFSARFAYGQKQINPQFYDPGTRFFMLRYPAVSLEYTQGIKGFLSSGFDYQSLKIRIEHQQRLNRFGYLSYIVEAGKIWGQAPYPYLAIPFGNQAILADRASFNMMNYLEFAADEYLAIHLEHHFEGLVMNRIPLVRKLKLRGLLFGKVFAGKLSPKNNQQLWAFPDRLFPIEKPYFEAGFGIENILKLGRVDLTWRLSYLDHPNVYRFLPKPSFQFRF